jgi:adenine-specific DNA-methyltransferase
MARRKQTPLKTREQLREKGQFWTPDRIADVMVAYALAEGRSTLFDPAVGAGVFFRAAHRYGAETGQMIECSGVEIDPTLLEVARQYGTNSDDVARVCVNDFIQSPPMELYSAIVANPPYVRHHRLPKSLKAHLKKKSLELTGKAIDGRAGLHLYFLLWSLVLLEQAGRLAFILPADTFEGKSAPHLWRWITCRYRLDTIITFDEAASPFPTIDTNPVIVLLEKGEPRHEFFWVRCHTPSMTTLKHWISHQTVTETESFTVVSRTIQEGISTGLSRFPQTSNHATLTLGDVAKVMRGVATGANDFFFLTERQIRELNISKEYFLSAIGRTRDVPGDEITLELLHQLEQKGRPTHLLYLNGTPLEHIPNTLKDYLAQGESLGLPKRPLIAQRRIWYRMETRTPPPILFAYLGRRNARFIRNTANVIPLTGFLCVYPLQNDIASINTLVKILNHPDTLQNLAQVGKSYGSGAIKVEPRALEKLPLPLHLVESLSLQPIQAWLF